MPGETWHAKQDANPSKSYMKNAYLYFCMQIFFVNHVSTAALFVCIQRPTQLATSSLKMPWACCLKSSVEVAPPSIKCVHRHMSQYATMTTAATMNTNNNLRLVRLVVYHLFLSFLPQSLLIFTPCSKQLWRCQAPQTPSAIRPSRNYTWLVICFWLPSWRVGSTKNLDFDRNEPEIRPSNT